MSVETEDRNQFPGWLQLRLDRRGWSSADLAKASGIAKSTISSWLSGARAPRNPELIHKLAYALDVQSREILEVLEFDDGGSNHMSFAVRTLAPVIDRYNFSPDQIKTIERLIRALAGDVTPPNIEE